MSTDVIKKRLKIISDLQEEMNKARTMFNEMLEEDDMYQDIQEEVNKVKEEVKEKKSKVLMSTKYKELEERMKELRQDLRENKELLSQDVADYYKDSGQLQIEDYEGKKKRIIFSVKLVNS